MSDETSLHIQIDELTASFYMNICLPILSWHER